MNIKTLLTVLLCVFAGTSTYVQAQNDPLDTEDTTNTSQYYSGSLNGQNFSMKFPIQTNKLDESKNFIFADAGDENVQYYFAALDLRIVTNEGKKIDFFTIVNRFMRELESTFRLVNPLTKETVTKIAYLQYDFPGRPFYWSTENAFIVQREIVKEGHAYYILAVALKTGHQSIDSQNFRKIHAFAESFVLKNITTDKR